MNSVFEQSVPRRSIHKSGQSPAQGNIRRVEVNAQGVNGESKPKNFV